MSSRLRAWFHGLRTTHDPRPASQRTDGDLVTAFAESRDGRPRSPSGSQADGRGAGDGEAAFAELVRRHGPMVLATCRRVLHPDTHSADDAFQATFLVLATKAGAVSPPERVGAWLYGVAVHVAKKARAWVRKVAPSAPSDLDKLPAALTEPDPDAHHIRAVIDDVLAGLPAKYRAPVVLCELEGRSRADAAAALGWTEGTLSGRLARAKKLLADRLARRGVALPATGLGVALLTQPATASVPTHLAASTVQAAALVAAGVATAEVTSEPVAALAREGCPSMSVTFKVLAAGIAGLGLTLGGFGVFKLFDRETVAAVPDTPSFAPTPAAADERPVPKAEEWKLAHTWRFPDKLTTVAVGVDVVLGGDGLGTLAVFDLKTGKERAKLRQGTDGGGPPGVERVQISADGKLLRLVLDSTGFHEMLVEPNPKDFHYPNGVATYDRGQSFGVTTDGREWLLYSKKDRELRVVRNRLATKPFEDDTEVVFKHDARVEFAAGASADAVATVTSARGNPVLRLWGKVGAKPVWEVNLWKEIGNIDVTGVAVSPGGKLVAVTGDAGAVWVFDAKTGKRIAKGDALTGPVNDVAFSPDGKKIAVACAESVARIIDAETGKELAVLKGHEIDEEVTCVAFGPDGTTIATGSADKTVKVWKLKK